jgi:CelD/BcsL family acetyltransferase involved in cellulose biosynthesis
VGVHGGKVATQRTRKKTYYPTDPDAQDTLRALVFDAHLAAWVREKGLTLDLAAEWERFASKALAKGYQYVDWRQAFMNWLTSPYQTPNTAPDTLRQRKEALRAWAEKGMQESTHGS